MNYPIVRLVSSPDVDATTRFDFHEWADDVLCCWTDPNEWQIQPGALLGEPDGIGADFGLGSVTFNLYVRTSRRDALAQMGRLARELRREENYLLFQLSADTPPIWYRTYKASPGALGFPFIDPDADDDVWVLPVSLVTDATGLGEQVSKTFQIANDPAAGDLGWLLSDIRGDAPAPATLTWETDTAYFKPVVVLTPLLDNTAPAVQVWQAESGTLGTDAATAADAAASDGTRVRIDFSTDVDMANRVTLSEVPILPGRYVAFGRVRANVGGGGSVALEGSGSALVSSTRTTLDEGGWRFVRLGEYAFPRGNMPAERGASLLPSGDEVHVGASNDGSATLDVDYVVVVQVDGLDLAGTASILESVGILTGGDGVGSTLTVTVDGEAEQVRITDNGVYYPATDPPRVRGSFPTLVPGAVNMLSIFSGAFSGATTGADALDSIIDVTLTYRPRHLWLPGS